uniref:Uncharacterized protein n=1 Tax=Meloidogyne enterolobii TaxID=390850 RepID=A0A6V7W3G4_MELEN|nr:unnamed protein product [Meloidogyne enterolobii]
MSINIFSKILFLINFSIYFIATIICSFSFSFKLPLPNLVPIRYDLQFQLPTASDKDPLVPTFVGTAKLEFQLTRQIPPYESKQQYLNNNEIIKLTFLSQKLDQFENITLIRYGEDEKEINFNVDVELRPPWEIDFLVREEKGGGGENKKLLTGRYILNIGRFEGIITYNKGLFYRDAGGLPLLASNFFFEFSPSLFPQLGGPLQKTTTKISLIHPHGTTALSSMHPIGPTESLNEHWQIFSFFKGNVNFLKETYTFCSSPKYSCLFNWNCCFA